MLVRILPRALSHQAFPTPCKLRAISTIKTCTSCPVSRPRLAHCTGDDHAPADTAEAGARTTAILLEHSHSVVARWGTPPIQRSAETPLLGKVGVMAGGSSKRYPSELPERAVRMVADTALES